MRAFILAVTGLVLSVAACSSYGTSVVAADKSPAKIASLSVSVPRSLVAGQTGRATATPKDANGTVLQGRVILWYTSSAAVANVTDSGVISAIAPGTAVLSAVSEGVSGQAAMSVTPPTPTPIATLSVSLNPTQVLVGQVSQATATAQDSSGNPVTGAPITWESSDVTVATVEATGHVTGIKSGNAMIKASSGGKSNSASLTVNAVAPVPVASVSVAPGSASVQVGSTVQLSAVTRDANNNTLTGRAISWSSSNGAVATVSASGLVTAVASGGATITATSEGQNGTSAITVTAPPPAPVASVSISPSSTSVQKGSTVQLSVVTRDANNNVVTGRVISWQSGNTAKATVNSSGVVTGVDTGTVQITATSEGVSGTASVTVTAPPPPPPPGSSNEPTGMTLIDERPFNSLGEHAAPYSPAWDTDSDPTYITIVQDATAPKSPSNVLRFIYPTGLAGGGGSAPTHTGVQFTGRRVLYLAYWAKYSSNWWGHLTGINKHGYVWANGIEVFVMESSGVGSGPMGLQMAIQGSPGFDAWYRPNLVPNATINRGEWFKMEYVLVGNSAGTADGTMDFWLNGVHVGSYTGLQYTSAATSWDIVALEPIWGGLGDVVPATMTWDVDHIYISGKN